MEMWSPCAGTMRNRAVAIGPSAEDSTEMGAYTRRVGGVLEVADDVANVYLTSEWVKESVPAEWKRRDLILQRVSPFCSIVVFPGRRLSHIAVNVCFEFVISMVGCYVVGFRGFSCWSVLDGRR